MSDSKCLESVAKEDFEGLSDVLFLTHASDREQDLSGGDGKLVVQNDEKVSVQFHGKIVTAVIERLCEAISRVCLLAFGLQVVPPCFGHNLVHCHRSMHIDCHVGYFSTASGHFIADKGSKLCCGS